jgi:Cu+-exporting ATPase
MNIFAQLPKTDPQGVGNLPTVIQLKVDGITCCGCVKGVKKALNVLYGVQDVEVNMSVGHVVVKGEGENMTAEKLERALRVAGFTVCQNRTEPSRGISSALNCR